MTDSVHAYAWHLCLQGLSHQCEPGLSQLGYKKTFFAEWSYPRETAYPPKDSNQSE